ncbi:MAG: NUDIX hydrolase, partial [Candidatus Obscuribacterales bacterium]|nr:NUDIX hydrolase [Candidatus Obscuribacterales bacterium]
MSLLSVVLVIVSVACGLAIAWTYSRMSKGLGVLALAVPFFLSLVLIRSDHPLDGEVTFFVSVVTFLVATAMLFNPSAKKSQPAPGKPEFRFCPNCANALEKRDFEGKDKLACPSCSFVHWNNPIVVGVALVPTLDGRGLVLVQRGLPPKVDSWCLPAGFGEPFEDPADTARRETGEEATLDVEIERLLAVRKAPGGNQVLIFYLAKPTDVTPQKGSDAKDAKVFSFDA